MIDLVRADYWYTDEYILEKTFARLNSSYELIHRRRYDDRIALSNTIAICVGNLFAKPDEKVPMKSYDELVNEESDKFGNHDDTYINEAFGWGLWFWLSNQ